MPTPEHQRLEAARTGPIPWKKWGPYLNECQWGTVREDSSTSGTAWDYFTHGQALVDPKFTKEQLNLLTREWYIHPNGQIPAYEWNFSDVNPLVHGWAAWRVYKIEQQQRGQGDRLFLERVFHKLLRYFTWWVNRKDIEGRNVFGGGFLGLDNIGVFDRSATLPTGGHLQQSDGTRWMGMYWQESRP